MNKKLLSVLLLMLGFGQLIAAPVELSKARKAGESFAHANFATVSNSLELDLVTVTTAYYVFNVGNSGFVIISADDSFRPVVGYSLEGVFDAQNPSPEMMYYLNSLNQGRQAALRNAAQPAAEVKAEWSALLNGKNMPSRNGGKASFYLVNTKWNQDYPYNKFCPREENGARTYAGCVATAMSQVMNYWKHPTHGRGQHSYVHYQFGELSADFSSAEYDFDNMPNSISATSPVEYIDAIATFMYHCGIAVDMGYSSDGSGAYSQDVPEAVLKYFGYSNCCRLFSRNAYSLEEFQSMLKDQFDLGWPCYYSGQDENGGGGHAFVCDGYDDNDMFHFNWGWSGSGDGFFVIDGLDVSSYAFNSDQAFIANFVPADVFTQTVKAPNSFLAVPNGDDEFSVTLSWQNPSATLQGSPIETIDQIVVMRDGSVIQTFDNPTPGETMTFVDQAGLPITVNYSVHAIYHGYSGRKAHENGVNLGPTCVWTVELVSESPNGWGDGMLSFLNSSGTPVAELSAESKESTHQVELPQSWVSFYWKAPTDSLQIGIKILNDVGQQVFAFDGPSTLMPEGFFYKMVNTCDGEGSVGKPSNLKAEIQGDDVVLTWTGISDLSYGYKVYRNGHFYTMVSEPVFTDPDAAMSAHSYYVTAFCVEGETDPSNSVCAITDNEELAPRNLDYEVLPEYKIKLSWEAPLNEENLAGYIIYRRAEDEEYERIKLCNANTNSYNDYFLVADGKRYFYKITSVYRRANVEALPARSLRNPDLLYVEVNRSHLPYGLTIEDQGNQVLLQWEQALLAETYNVYRNGLLIAEGLTEPMFADAVNGEPSYYYVTGVYNGVESSPSYKVCYGNYAVNDTYEAPATVFPNPSKGWATVQSEGLREVVVYSLTGQQLIRSLAKGEELNVNLSNLEAGVYYFRIKTDRGCQIQKVVLVK